MLVKASFRLFLVTLVLLTSTAQLCFATPTPLGCMGVFASMASVGRSLKSAVSRITGFGVDLSLTPGDPRGSFEDVPKEFYEDEANTAREYDNARRSSLSSLAALSLLGSLGGGMTEEVSNGDAVRYFLSSVSEKALDVSREIVDENNLDIARTPKNEKLGTSVGSLITSASSQEAAAQELLGKSIAGYMRFEESYSSLRISGLLTRSFLAKVIRVRSRVGIKKGLRLTLRILSPPGQSGFSVGDSIYPSLRRVEGSDTDFELDVDKNSGFLVFKKPS